MRTHKTLLAALALAALALPMMPTVAADDPLATAPLPTCSELLSKCPTVPPCVSNPETACCAPLTSCVPCPSTMSCCTTVTCPPPCTDLSRCRVPPVCSVIHCPPIIVPNPCETVRCDTPLPCTDSRDCYPEPQPWSCTTGPGHEGGVVGDTEDYASALVADACVVALGGGNIVLQTAGDAAYGAYTQADATLTFVESLRVTFPADAQLVRDAAGEASMQGAMACAFLLGPSQCSGPSPAPAPGTCAAPIPPGGGGVIGSAVDYAHAACDHAQGGADAISADAGDLAVAAVAAVRGLGDDVSAFAGDRVSDATALAGVLLGDAGSAVDLATWAAGFACDATMQYLVGQDC